MLLLVIAAVVAYVALTFDPNQYKAQIIAAVQERTQRTLKLEGDLALSFWPSLGAKIGKASLSERGADREFAAVQEAHVSLKLLPLLSGQATVLDCLAWRPELGAKLLVVDRETGDARASIPIGNRYCLHHVHAGEEDGKLVLDVLELEEPVYPDYQGLPDLFIEVRPARTVRMVLDPERGRLLERRESGPGIAADFQKMVADYIEQRYGRSGKQAAE